MNIAIVVAAGYSSRMNGNDKIFLKLKGKPVIYWTLLPFITSLKIDGIIVVTKRESMMRLKRLIKNWDLQKILSICLGGATRQESVFCGIKEAIKQGCKDKDLILIHDGARPLIKQNLIEKIIDEVKKFRVAILAVPVKETIKNADDNLGVINTPNREKMWVAQTPQAASLKDFKLVIESGKKYNGTDEASLFEQLKIPVKIVPGDYSNIKITTNEDLKIAKSLL